MRKQPLRTMIATMTVAYGLLLVTVFFGGSPTLGLDLQGGIAVNLQPVEDGEVTEDVTDDQLDQAIEIIRRRVDALGVAEPEVSRQGTTISVQLPGARDQAEVLEVVGQTARLEFRPVLAPVGSIPQGEDREQAEGRVAELREELGIPEGVTVEQIIADEAANTPGADTSELEPPVDGDAVEDDPAEIVEEPAGGDDGTTDDATTGNGGGRSVTARGAAAQDAPEDGAEQGTETEEAPEEPVEPMNQWGVDLTDERLGELYAIENQLNAQITPPEEREDDQEVTLPMEDGTVYRLGPLALDGRSVETASSGLGNLGEWTVNLVFHGGEEGIDLFNEIAAACFGRTATCPDTSGQGRPGQLAIVLDNEILSAPTINNASFARDSISISGAFNQESAEALAVALRFGSLPIELEPQQAETVSATLGQGALQAGIISGLIGLALAAIYMLFYYRLLALVAIGSLTISAAALWVIMSFIGATVTLAGVVGIVVSVGVTIDSTIVYFEGLKEYVRGGASVRAAVDRSFTTAYSTIIKANIALMIGAGVLYWLAIGPVRGFAFYLGAMTLLNLGATYLFVYPATALIGRSKLAEHPSRLGIAPDELQSGPSPTDPGPSAATSITGASS